MAGLARPQQAWPGPADKPGPVVSYRSRPGQACPHADKPGPLVTSLAHSSQIRRVCRHLDCTWKPGPLAGSLARSRQARPTPTQVTSPARSHTTSLSVLVVGRENAGHRKQGCRDDAESSARGDERVVWVAERDEGGGGERPERRCTAGSAEPALVSRDTAIARRLHVAVLGGSRPLGPPAPAACSRSPSPPELRCAPHHPVT